MSGRPDRLRTGRRGWAENRPAPLAVRYEVVDPVAARLDELPHANLLRWVAAVEQSVQVGTLRRHPDLFPEAALREILAPPSITEKLGELFRYDGYRFAKAADTDLYNTDMCSTTWTNPCPTEACRTT